MALNTLDRGNNGTIVYESRAGVSVSTVGCSWGCWFCEARLEADRKVLRCGFRRPCSGLWHLGLTFCLGCKF